MLARVLTLAGVATSLLAPAIAHAEELPMPEDRPPPPVPRDNFLNPPKRGTWASFDAYTLGVQATLEHRISIERDDYAAIIPRISSAASLGYGEVATHMDARFLFFSVGASGGFRHVWRTYQFAPGIEGTRDLRREIDEVKGFSGQSWLYGEGRVRMALPMSNSFMFVGNAAARYEDCPDNSFDWFHATMHDRGVLFRYDATLFLRGSTIGAIGPTVRIMDLPRLGRREIEIAAGITAGRRVGLLPNDIVLLNLLVRPGDDQFGLQILRMPVAVLLVYRVSLELGG